MTPLQMYNRGHTRKQIAESFRVSSSTVARMLQSDPGYVANSLNRRVDIEYVHHALFLRNQGVTWPEVADIIGYHQRTLQRAVKYYAAQGLIK